MTVSQTRSSTETKTPSNFITNKLINAAKRGDTDEVFKLLNRTDASPLVVDSIGKSVSIYFAYFNNGGAVVRLAQQAPEVLHQQDSFGRTPVQWLAIHGNGNAVLALAEIESRVLTHADKEGKTPLMMLSKYDNTRNKNTKTSLGLEVLLGLSQAPCALEEKLNALRPDLLTQTDVYGRTVALNLAEFGDADVIIALALKSPFVLNQTCNMGANMAIWLAMRECHTAVVELAEYMPSDVLEVTDNDGLTVGAWLARNGASDALRVLADIYLAVKEQPGIVEQAVKVQNAPLANQLIRAGFALPNDFAALVDEMGLKHADVGLIEVS